MDTTPLTTSFPCLISKNSLRVPNRLVPSAWHEHGPFLFWLMDILRPRCFVELGTYHGYSYFTACQAVRESGLGTTCYAIDNWHGDQHAGFYGDEVFDQVQTHNSLHYSAFSQLIRATFDDAVNYFPEKSIDLLHIDGRHFYEDVLHDFLMWRPKLTADAIVLLHDTNARERDFGVWKLFDELRREYPSFEFKHSHGLGVIAPEQMPAALVPLFAADESTADLLRALYASVGGAISYRWGQQAAVTALQDRQAAKEAEFGTRIAALEEQLAASRRRHEDENAELAAVQGNLAVRDSKLATLNKQLVWYQSRISDARNEASRWKDELNATIAKERQRIRQLEAELQETSHAYDRLINSRSWRVTAPARRVIERHPRIGRTLRDGVRAFWWVGTLRTSRLVGAIHARRRARREERIVVESGLFDESFYLNSNPDVARSGHTPAWHYLVHGWWHGLRPHPLFDGEWYRRQNPDVAEARINPLVHFIETGMPEYRDPNPFFDMRWYTTMNPDVVFSGLDPIRHFMTTGAARLADPSPAFSTAWYLDQNPDVAALGINPLVHYLAAGQREGRWPRLPLPDLVSARPVTSAQIDCRKPVVVRRETALFVTHSPDGYLKPHVRVYLRALAREGIGIVLIIAADRGFVEDESELYSLVDGLLVRSNEGFDFAAWAHVLRLHRELHRADILYLLNDSVIGPVSDSIFHAAIERVRATQADLIGMTDNYERGWHIQSYFLALKQGALRCIAWHQFLHDIVSFPSKDDVINSYEVRLAPTLAAAGLATAALFKAKSRSGPTIYHWKELLDDGFPFIKVMAIRDEFPGVDRNGWYQTLVNHGFDVTVVDEILAGKRIEPPQATSADVQRFSSVPAAPRRPLRVAFIGPWNYDNGLGVASRGYITALKRTGYTCNLLPIAKPFHVHQHVGISADYKDFVGPADVAIAHVNPDGWDALLTEGQRELVHTAPIRIGAFIWESQQLPACFDQRFREIDAVWAPTSYCAEIFQSTASLPVHTVHFPLGVRERRRGATEIAEMKRWLGLQSNNRLILFAFDASSYLARKNPFALLTAFQQANLASAGWRLVLKMKHSSDDSTGSRRLREAVRGCDGVHLIDRPIGDEEMSSLMEAADIYASPHSSEGFGLTIAEAMALGRVTVATDYGGCRDFLTPETGFPVRWRQWQTEHDEGVYAKGTIWAKVDEEHLAECLIAAATLPENERQRIGECARERIRNTLSPEAVAAEIRASIESLLPTGLRQ